MADSFVNDAKVMSKGQVTIPKNVREALGIKTGDRVTFIVNNGQVTIMNSTLYALQRLQSQMSGEAEKAGFKSEKDVIDWISKSRHEECDE